MHDPLASAGAVDDAIAEIGGTTRLCDLSVPSAADILAGCAGGEPTSDGLVILGGAMHAGDDRGYPHFLQLLDIIRRFHATGRPVLGICLGAQLVGRAFGEQVRRQGFVERGFRPIRLASSAADDPLFHDVPGTPTVLHWHEDRVDPPAGAVRLASSDACDNQAFRIGRSTYGVQCHLEVTPTVIDGWTELWRAMEAPGSGSLAAFQRDIELYLPAAVALGREVARRWLALCIKSAREEALAEAASVEF